jgi:hypothetical protein
MLSQNRTRKFPFEWLNTSFHDSLGSNFINSSILLFVYCLFTITSVLLFPLPIFILTI